MRRRTVLAGTLITGGSLVAGCLGDDNANAPSEVETISMHTDRFDPIRLSIDVGAGVRWVNESDASISLTSSRYSDDANSWSLSETVLAGDESETVTFSEPGIYHYHDIIKTRDRVCGAIVVGDITDEIVLPCD